MVSVAAAETMKPGAPHEDLPADAGQATIANLDKIRNANGSQETSKIRRNMQRIMQNDAAVFRTQVCISPSPVN